MKPSPQASADAASDSYKNRPQSDIDSGTVHVKFDGQQYAVFGYKDDPATGFHGTAYKEIAPPHNIIIAYRGTDPGLFSGNDKLGHALTTAQDIAVDATMVRDHVNPQVASADAFTKEMLAKAEKHGISKDQVTVAGHSLGGTLAEAEAAKFQLGGATFNAFGAVGIVPGVPEGGRKVIDYVMAGDVVSAANHHYGQVVNLASKEDIQSLKTGRYLDAPAGSPPPNSLMAMRLGDHGIGGNFNGPNSMLNPANLDTAKQRYADNKAAVDAYRGDVYHERGELAMALRQDHVHYGQTRLPPDIQRQVNEYLTVNADPAVQKAIEQNRAVAGAEHGLQHGADAARTGGQFVQTQDERLASGARTVGETMWPWNPGAALGAAALGEAAHLHGQVSHAVGDEAASLLESARHTVQQGAHDVSQTAKAALHSPQVQAVAVKGVNAVVDTYGAAVSTGHAVEQNYDHARQAVSRDIDAAEQTAGKAYDTLTHPGQWFQHDAAPTQTGHSASPQPPHSQAIKPDSPGFSQSDPRHPGNPQHALFNELKGRFPEAGEPRLMQFTAACHTHKINERNLDMVHFNRQDGLVGFGSHGWDGAGPKSVIVDVKQPSPQAAQSIQQIQNHDHHQVQMQANIHAQMAQTNAQGPQGPTPGGR